MSGGGGGTQAGGPAPIPLLQAENTGFGQIPWTGTPAASGQAYGGIGGLNTNPASQYGLASAVGQNFTGFGNNLAAQAQGAYQAGQDPQNALYAKQYQQNQDQANAVNAQNGVGGTPYGAGLANQADQNFNLNWQNQQLQRENTAANTASTLLGAGGNAATTGLGLGQSIDTQQYNAQQQKIQDYINYLLGSSSNAANYFGAANNTYGTGVNAANVSSNAALTANQQSNAALGGLGSLAGSLVKFI